MNTCPNFQTMQLNAVTHPPQMSRQLLWCSTVCDMQHRGQHFLIWPVFQSFKGCRQIYGGTNTSVSLEFFPLIWMDTQKNTDLHRDCFGEGFLHISTKAVQFMRRFCRPSSDTAVSVSVSHKQTHLGFPRTSVIVRCFFKSASLTSISRSSGLMVSRLKGKRKDKKSFI